MNRGSAPAISLGTDRLGLEVDPGFGARVIGLTDRNSGRQWLVQGPRVGDGSDGAAYLGAESQGWDECFPTVLSCDHPAWGGGLRDHGMLWGRPWVIVDAGPGHLDALFEADGIRFSRRLTVQGAGLTADYAVTSSRAAPVPYLWSQHCVLSVTPDDRIVLTGQQAMNAEGIGFDWPIWQGRDLSRIGCRDDGFALKSYALTPGRASAGISSANGGLRFDWDGTEVPALGVWLNYGGWPAKGQVHHIALEPTTGAADDVVSAQKTGQARMLDPGETHRWSMRLTLLDPEPGPLP